MVVRLRIFLPSLSVVLTCRYVVGSIACEYEVATVKPSSPSMVASGAIHIPPSEQSDRQECPMSAEDRKDELSGPANVERQYYSQDDPLIPQPLSFGSSSPTSLYSFVPASDFYYIPVTPPVEPDSLQYTRGNSSNSELLNTLDLQGLEESLANEAPVDLSALHLLPQVTKVNVTTPSTADASQKRRKQPANFPCPVPGCGSVFTRHFNLKGHLRSHAEEKPYQCKWPGCGKGFALQRDCKRHEQLHPSVGRYPCQECGKSFARADALKEHCKLEFRPRVTYRLCSFCASALWEWYRVPNGPVRDRPESRRISWEPRRTLHV